MSTRPTNPYDAEGLEAQVTGVYHALGDLAEALTIATRPPEGESGRDFVDNLGWRLPLDEVRGYLLAARHELHGALTALVKLHGQTPLRRPTDGDPEATSSPGADLEAAQRARRPD